MDQKYYRQIIDEEIRDLSRTAESFGILSPAIFIILVGIFFIKISTPEIFVSLNSEEKIDLFFSKGHFVSYNMETEKFQSLKRNNLNTRRNLIYLKEKNNRASGYSKKSLDLTSVPAVENMIRYIFYSLAPRGPACINRNIHISSSSLLRGVRPLVISFDSSFFYNFLSTNKNKLLSNLISCFSFITKSPDPLDIYLWKISLKGGLL